VGASPLFGAVALRAVHEPPALREALVLALEAERDRTPDLPDLRRALALLYRADDRVADAWALIEDLPPPTDGSADPDFQMLRIELMASEVGPDAAAEALDALLSRPGTPDRLWFLASRFYVDQQRLDGARDAFEVLLSRRPGDTDLLLSLGLIALQQQDLPAAAGYLERLRARGTQGDTAAFYLGEVYQGLGRARDALASYAEVGEGPEFTAALARWADLMRETGDLAGARTRLDQLRGDRPELAIPLTLIEANVLVRGAAVAEAVALLDRALAEHPDDGQLRYTRALQRQQLGDLAGMEADLRHVLAAEPDHAAALNALGYTLADQTERLDEAYELIRRAYELEPDDPAVVDSLGWVHYRMGNLDEALHFLRAAHARFPDPEVVAHLGEVLWVAGERRAARRLLRDALERAPDSVVLRRVVDDLLGS
jgi:predicted Zn-dependent protease